jgi:hypothetical protein
VIKFHEISIGSRLLKVARLNTPERKCNECRQPVPNGAKICPSCRSYLDWRRYIAVGQTNLALLVAILSVLTTMAAVGIPLFQTRGADLKIVFESMTDDTVTLLARNDGRASGIMTVHSLQVIIKNISGESFGDAVYSIPISHKGQIVEPGKEVQLTANIGQPRDYSKDICVILKREKYVKKYGRNIEDLYWKDYEGLSCTIETAEASFYSSPSRGVPRVFRSLPCSQLMWLNQCVFGLSLSGEALKSE